jgi:hypothetical protein
MDTGTCQAAGFDAAGMTFPTEVPAARSQRGPQCTPGDAPTASHTTVDTLRSQLQTMRTAGNLSAGRLQNIERMLGIAEQGGLLQRQDAHGVTLLEHLSRIAATPPSHDLIAYHNTNETVRATPGHVMVAVLENLTAPEAINQRGSSCAARALEYLTATQDTPPWWANWPPAGMPAVTVANRSPWIAPR